MSTHSTVTIRRAKLADVPAITNIYNEAILTTTATFDTEPKSVAERTRWLQSHDQRHPIMVAVVNGKVVGWASLSPWSERSAYDDTAETSFYVHSTHRGRGIGRRLKEELIEEARRLRFHTLIARVAEGSRESVHLNESAGFVHIGTMKDVGRKFGRLLDVHVMQKMLEQSRAMNPFDSSFVAGRCARGPRTSIKPTVGARKKTWREKLADNKGFPKVSKIDPTRSKRWGTGTFVIPAPIEVDELMRRVPRGRLTTIDELRKVLAKRHGATIACPITTGIFAWIAAHAAAETEAEGRRGTTPYWRTLKSKGELNPKYPGGIAGLKRKLKAEGHQVFQKGKRFFVESFQQRLAAL